MDASLTQYLVVLVCGIYAAVTYTLAIVVLRKGFRIPHDRVWVVTCLLAGTHTLLIALTSFLTLSTDTALILTRLAFSLGVAFQALIVAFALLFTRFVSRSRLIHLVNVLWGGGLVILIWGTDLVLAGVVEADFARIAPVAGPLVLLFGLYTAATWLTCLLLVGLTIRRSRGLKRTQTIYVLIAFVFGLIGSLSFLRTTVAPVQNVLVFLPACLIVLFPLTITYATVRYRLLEVRTIMHRTAVWGVLSLLLLLPLWAILWAAAALGLDVGTLELAVLLTGLFLLSYVYLRVVKPRLDHVFQRGVYDRRDAVDKFARGMSELGKPGDVARQFLASLGETLYPSRATVLFRPEEDARWQVEGASEGGEDLDPEKLDLDGLFVWRLVEVGSAVERSQLEVDGRFASVRAEGEAHFEASGAQVCLPLVQGGELVGLVHLGERRNLRAYSSEDLEFLEQLGAAASIGLANALLFERVDAQRRDLKELAGNLERRVQERTRELEAANEGLKELDRLKSRFFANISHELRTPLTLILAPLGSMLSGSMGSFSDEQREHLQGIRSSGMELLKFINDLLDLSKLEESRMRLLVEKVDLGALLERIAGYSEPLAERKNIRVELKAGAGPVVEADARKLERVFVNLLTNALKFTEEGGRVTLGARERGGKAVVTVEDTGIGIPEESLGRIFDRFHQVDDTTIRTRGGTGIGLALAKELVELHTGSLAVESSIGRGSTFSVEIPLKADGIPGDRIDRRVVDVPVPIRRREEDLGLPEWNEEVLASPEYRFMGIEAATERRLVPRTGGSGFKSARLLVVDDNPELLKYVHRVLSEFYDVMPVQDGERAWEVMQKEHPDLVISDVMMPGMSGLELCRLIKQEPATQETPVILLTARGSTEHRIEGHEVGADEYIPKPFEADELLAAVSGLLLSKVRRSEVAARRHSASLETLLAGMAHELRNASHQIKSAHAVMRKLSSRALASGSGQEADVVSDLRGRVEKMDAISNRALSRISKVVRGLQQYSIGQMSLAWSDVDVDDLVRREVRMLGVEDRSVQVDLALGSVGAVRGSTEEIRQMILNLVENAVHAVEEGGRVRVRTERLPGKVRIVVQDDGRGIPAEVLDRVFDPFFTTRDPGQGMGLGLALVKRTVTDHGGSIEIASQVGEGTEVVVEIPALGAGGLREAESEA